MVVELRCEDVWREISNYLECEIEPGLRATMEAHLGLCSRCAAVLDGTRNVVRLVGDGRSFDVAPGFGSRLYTKLANHLDKVEAAAAPQPVASADISLGVTDERIALSSHAVYFWENEEQFERGVRFLEPGLAGNDQCIVFGYDSTNRQVLAVLRKLGFDVENLMQRRRLILLSRNALAPAILSDVAALFESAVRTGAPAIRFLGTLVLGAEGWPGGDDDVLELESKVSRAAARYPSVVLCMYDVRTLSGRVMLKGGFQTHPLVLCEDGLRENPYYVPEEPFLAALRHLH